MKTVQLLRDSDLQVFGHVFTARRVCVARTMMSQDVCLFVIMSVCPSVTRRYCIETSKCMIELFSSPWLIYHSSFPCHTQWQDSDGRLFRWGMKNFELHLLC